MIYGNKIASTNLIGEIEKSVNNRVKHPNGFKKYASKNNPEELYYKIQVKNFTIFYIVTGDIMEARRIIYSHRDLDNLV